MDTVCFASCLPSKSKVWRFQRNDSSYLCIAIRSHLIHKWKMGGVLAKEVWREVQTNFLIINCLTFDEKPVWQVLHISSFESHLKHRVLQCFRNLQLRSSFRLQQNTTSTTAYQLPVLLPLIATKACPLPRFSILFIESCWNLWEHHEKGPQNREVFLTIFGSKSREAKKGRTDKTSQQPASGKWDKWVWPKSP